MLLPVHSPVEFNVTSLGDFHWVKQSARFRFPFRAPLTRTALRPAIFIF